MEPGRAAPQYHLGRRPRRCGTQFGFANDCVGFTNDPTLLVNSNCFLVDYNSHGLPKGTARSRVGTTAPTSVTA